MQYSIELSFPDFNKNRFPDTIASSERRAISDLFAVDSTVSRIFDEFIGKKREIDRNLKGVLSEIRNDIESKLDFAGNVGGSIKNFLDHVAEVDFDVIEFRHGTLNVIDIILSYEDAKSMSVWEKCRADFLRDNKSRKQKQSIPEFYRICSPEIRMIDLSIGRTSDDFNNFVLAFSSGHIEIAKQILSNIVDKIIDVLSRCLYIISTGLRLFSNWDPERESN